MGIYTHTDILIAVFFILFLTFYYNPTLLISVCDYLYNKALHCKSKEEWKLCYERCLDYFAESIFEKKAILI